MKSKKRKYQRRDIVLYKHKPYDDTKRNDTIFVPLFSVFMMDMRKIAMKKGFNKKEFSSAFRRFEDVTGAYPFPKHLVTRYLKEH